MKTIAAYVVLLNEDGSISTEIVRDFEKVEREATTFDIYQSSRELVSDIESQLLADRIARTVAERLQPKDAAEVIKEKIINALNDRKSEAPIE